MFVRRRFGPWPARRRCVRAPGATCPGQTRRRRLTATNKSARFTLHHKLYGDFAARGGLQFGGNEEERRGAADLNIGGSPPPAAPKKKESEEEKRRRKIRPLDMPKEKRTSANCPLPKTSSDGSVALSEMSG